MHNLGAADLELPELCYSVAATLRDWGYHKTMSYIYSRGIQMSKTYLALLTFSKKRSVGFQ